MKSWQPKNKLNYGRLNFMSRKCPLYGDIVVYLDCLECEEKLCKKRRKQMEKNKENAIEWLTGQDTITLSLTQQRYITKVRKLKKKFPKLVKIRTNKDGSIFAKLPLSALKFSIILREGVELSEEEKDALVERLQKGRNKTQDSDWD